jgi:hypothetical protein
MVSDSTSNTATTDRTLEQEHTGPEQPEQQNPEPTDTTPTDTTPTDTEPAGTTSTGTPGTGAFAPGAAAVVSAGLGITSLTGTGLGDMLRARQEIVGQIQASTGGGGGDQVDALYGAPWHTSALVSGVIALLAVLIGVVLLAAHSSRSGTAPWIKSVALGGAVLGVLGILVSGGMYLDLFAAQPQLPPMPSLGG